MEAIRNGQVIRQSERNSVKYRALYILSLLPAGESLSARELSYAAGVDLHSLRVLLKRWVRWNLVTAASVNRLAGTCYRIGARGRVFLEYAPRYLPVERWLHELAMYQKKLEG